MANPFVDAAGGLFGRVFSSILWFGIVFLIVVILIGIPAFMLYRRRKFNILVKVRSERTGDPAVFFDKAAIIYDRIKKTKYFRLSGLKVDLPVPPYKVISAIGKISGCIDYIEVLRKSEEEFVFLTYGRIDKKHVVKSDGKLYPVLSTEQKQIEPDIYWYLTRKEDLKKLFDPESIWAKLLPWIPHILTGVILVFILWVLMDKLPKVLTELIELTKELRSLKGASVVVESIVGGLIWKTNR